MSMVEFPGVGRVRVSQVGDHYVIRREGKDYRMGLNRDMALGFSEGWNSCLETLRAVDPAKLTDGVILEGFFVANSSFQVKFVTKALEKLLHSFWGDEDD
jgi:molybdopterin-guanine dinucleotide biosynthesis protein